MLADYYSAVLKHPLLRAACLEGKLEFKVFFPILGVWLLSLHPQPLHPSPLEPLPSKLVCRWCLALLVLAHSVINLPLTAGYSVPFFSFVLLDLFSSLSLLSNKWILLTVRGRWFQLTSARSVCDSFTSCANKVSDNCRMFHCTACKITAA